MKWQSDLRALRRGLRIARKLARSELGQVWRSERKTPFRSSTGQTGQRPAGPDHAGLRMLAHVPESGIRPGAPLVVVLHGCGQQAQAFADASGWTTFADRLGFPLLLPEQSEDNNQGRCFRWFLPSHTSRGSGEAACIIDMIRASMARWGTDPRRVYVVGLSAGGAMAAALLASYPDVFAAGAVVGGLPVGAAHSSVQALMRMAKPGPDLSAADWANAVKRAGPAGFPGPWPPLSIWAGEGDTIVAPENSSLLAIQWRALHACPPTPTSDLTYASFRCRRWGPASAPPVELWTMPGLAHGYPVGEGVGYPAPFLLHAPIAATSRIAAFWGLTGAT